MEREQKGNLSADCADGDGWEEIGRMIKKEKREEKRVSCNVLRHTLVFNPVSERS